MYLNQQIICSECTILENNVMYSMIVYIIFCHLIMHLIVVVICC